MENPSLSQRTSPFLPMFESFRAELDEHHDRRERIIKASRDITAASKKIIFALQRVRTLASAIPTGITNSLQSYQTTIRTNFSAITADLQSINAYRYYRQVSPGIQEWMESLLFHHYLATQTLLTYSESVEELRKLSRSEAPPRHEPAAPAAEPQASEPSDPPQQPQPQSQSQANDPTIALTPTDYLLGLFDTTGELMRFAITSIATSGSLPTSTSSSNRTALHDLQTLRQQLTMFDYGDGPFARDADKKLEVTLQSVEKVEKAMYGLVVRGSERPKGWVPEMEAARGIEVEGY